MSTEQDAPELDAPTQNIETGTEEPKNTAKLFVRPIGFDVSSEELQEHFNLVAPVTDVQVMRGYAFVAFESPSAAADAYSNLQGSEFAGQSLSLEFAKDRKEDTRGKFRVKVSGLPEGASWQDLKDFVRDKTGSPATFSRVFRDYDSGLTVGVVEFATADEHSEAISTLDGSDYEGSTLKAEEDTSPFVARRNDRGGRGGPRGPRGGRGDRRGFRDSRGRGRGGYRDNFRGGRDGGDDGYRGGGRGQYDRGDYRGQGGDGPRNSYNRDRSPTRY